MVGGRDVGRSVVGKARKASPCYRPSNGSHSHEDIVRLKILSSSLLRAYTKYENGPEVVNEKRELSGKISCDDRGTTEG